MTSDMIEGIIFIGIGGFLFWLYKAGKKQKSTRSKEFRRFAADHTFFYSDTRDFDTLDLPKDAWLGAWGTPATVEYLLEWSENDVQVMVCEYTYTDNVTQKSDFKQRWLLSLKKSGANFPWFRSCPRKDWQYSYPWWHKGWEQVHAGAGQTLTTQNIIKSNQKKVVERLLSPSVIDRLRWFDGFQIEGIQDYLFIVSGGTLSPGQALLTMTSKGVSLINSLADEWQEIRK